MSILMKYEEDVIRAFQDTHFKIKGLNERVNIKINNILSPIIHEILSSYYFENKIEPEMNLDTEYKKGFINLSFNNYYDVTPYSSLIKVREGNDLENIIIDKEKLIKRLKEIDPYYEILLEKNPIKMKLNLINKNQIEFSVIKTDSKNIIKDMLRFHKVLNFEKMDIENPFIKSYIIENFKDYENMEYFNDEFSHERFFIVAHNNNQIAGLSCISNYMVFNDYKENDDKYYTQDKMFFGSYINVGKQFRGKGLSIKLMEKTLDFIEEKNGIFIRSNSTLLGKERLYNNTNNLILKRKNICVIDSKSEEYFKFYKKIIKSVKNDLEYDVLLKIIRPIFRKISEINNNYEHLKSNAKDHNRIKELQENKMNLIYQATNSIEEKFEEEKNKLINKKRLKYV